MSFSSQPGNDRFRILLYRRNGNQLLLKRNAQGFALPDVRIPPYTRVVQQINQAIWKDWRLQSFCLFPVGDPNSPAYAAELCGTVSTPPANMNWFPVDSLAQRDFPEAQDFHAIDAATKLFDQYRNAGAGEPFGKFGWLRDVTEWVVSKATQIGLHLTGNFEQFNASPTFSLVRFETNGSALWFKAVGEPNLREYPITAQLTKFFPVYVPKIIGTRADWNAWLAVEVEGIHLDETSDFDMWSTAATTLANLQIASLGQSLHLIHAGCRDARVCSLVDLVNPFLEVMAKLMDRQTKDSPPRLSRNQLSVLGSQLQDALASLSYAQIPNALGHLDFNPGNILISRNRCVFLDWAEACVGHPFLTFQFLLERWRRLHPLRESWESKLQLAYLEGWRSLTEPCQLTEALAIAPLLAVFTYAAVGQAWHDARWRDRTDAAGYLRSLTRRIRREADRWAASRSHRTAIRCNPTASEVLR